MTNPLITSGDEGGGARIGIQSKGLGTQISYLLKVIDGLGEATYQEFLFEILSCAYTKGKSSQQNAA